MKVGIVGMPNAGKSSLFNALTAPGPRPPTTRSRRSSPTWRSCRWRTSGSTRSRHDGRVERRADTIEFHDIAGLVAGAHKGEGLGNKFLANIRETDALLHVVRAHGDENVIHPEGRSSRPRDIETIETELLYADLEQAERRHARVVRRLAAATRRQCRAGVASSGGRGAAGGQPAARSCPRPSATRCATCRR